MFLRLLLPCLLSLFLNSACAETIPASLNGSHGWSSSSGFWSGEKSWSESIDTCNSVVGGGRPIHSTSPAAEPSFSSGVTTATVTIVYNTYPYSVSCSITSGQSLYTCPSGQNWTLDGQNCSRPDCVDGSSRDPNTGLCADPCQSKIDLGTKFGIYTFPVGSSITGTYCDSGCRLNIGVTTQPYYTDGKTVTKVMSQTYMPGACTASDGVAPLPGLPGQTPPDPPKEPPCLPTEGVMTSSTGAIHCVPEGIPGSNKPVVGKDKSVKTNADGSTTTTETTTTRDPTTGVETKNTTTTDRNGSGQVTGTSSETGTKGSTQGQDPTKPQNSKFCAENPDLQICKGGLNEEETQKKVKEGVEKVRDSLDAKDFNAESFFEGKDVSQAARDIVDQKLQSAKGEIEAFASGGPSSESFISFESEMANWFEPISVSGCQAFTVHVGNWVWTHDHCEVAAKISEIGAYAMWVLFAFSIFSMTTRDHR